MVKVRIVPPVYEKNDGTHHKEHQCVNTRVSHYMRLYATGKISEFPTSGLVANPELPEDLRNDLLNRNLPLPEMGTDPVEIMDYLTANRERYNKLVTEYNLAIEDSKRYEAAMKTIDDKNSSPEEIAEAVKLIEAIEAKARARNL